MNTLNNPTIAPCLWFDDSAEEAAAFYVETHGAGRVIASARFPSSSDNPAGKPRGSVMSVDFEIHGQRFTAVNGGPQFVINPSISFFAHVGSEAEAERLFAALSNGGVALMPLDAYPWSPCFGWAVDRFGVSWQVTTVPPQSPQSGMPPIAPSLMFCGKQLGNAMSAMERFCGVFPASRIGKVERFGPDEDGAGLVKYGRVVLAGQHLVAMDSPGDHAFGFNEAVSLQVLCDGQPDVDHYWAELSRDGEPGQCGWLKDRFGISWQVVPKQWLDWLGTDADDAARERVFEAMLPMTKLDVAALERAFAGA